MLGEPGDLGWVVIAHGELYAAEFGWDSTFEALVARIVADYATTRDPAVEQAWIAEQDGRRVGCVFCVRRDAETAQLRILLVDPVARGRRLGEQLVPSGPAKRVGQRECRQSRAVRPGDGQPHEDRPAPRPDDRPGREGTAPRAGTSTPGRRSLDPGHSLP